MRIKLAILENNLNYLNKIVTAFNAKYADKFEIYSFTDQAIAVSTLESARIDVFIASNVFDIDVDSIPKKCGFAYLVDTPGIDNINNQKAICKFQKADVIYKQILNIYDENADDISGIKLGDESTTLISFCSVSGGTGASSMAAAAAIHYANMNQKTLYLNLEKLGSADSFFSGDGQFDMSDIIFAIKSKKSKLSLKLEICAKQDVTGVYFYSQPKLALNMYELTTEDIITLIRELKSTGEYDYIIFDMDFDLNNDVLSILNHMHSIVFVGDGSEVSNRKIHRTYQSLMILEQNSDILLTDRLCMIYNKFSNKTSKILNDIGIRSLGGSPRFEHASCAYVVDQLSKMDFFSKII